MLLCSSVHMPRTNLSVGRLDFHWLASFHNRLFSADRSVVGLFATKCPNLLIASLRLQLHSTPPTQCYSSTFHSSFKHGKQKRVPQLQLALAASARLHIRTLCSLHCFPQCSGRSESERRCSPCNLAMLTQYVTVSVFASFTLTTITPLLVSC